MSQISNINKVNQPYLTKFEFKEVFNFIEYKKQNQRKIKRKIQKHIPQNIIVFPQMSRDCGTVAPISIYYKY